jgi:hypothetical protein
MTDDQIDVIDGKRDQLIGRLQEIYSYQPREGRTGSEGLGIRRPLVATPSDNKGPNDISFGPFLIQGRGRVPAASASRSPTAQEQPRNKGGEDKGTGMACRRGADFPTHIDHGRRKRRRIVRQRICRCGRAGSTRPQDEYHPGHQQDGADAEAGAYSTQEVRQLHESGSEQEANPGEARRRCRSP